MHGELSNRVPGKVTGWLRFFRRGKPPLNVVFDLEGDFHEDIRGADIMLVNPNPSDENESLGREGTYMEGFAQVQRGTVGDITAGLPLGPWTEELARRLMQRNEIVWRENGLTGEELEERRREVAADQAANIAAGKLYHPYVAYPYVEWFSDNGRVVLELGPDQVRIVRNATFPPKEKTPEELVQDEKKRAEAFCGFMRGMVERLSHENREQDGDGDDTGIVVG